MIIGDNQAPVTQKATDHIDEELRLAIFKTLKLSQIFFSHFVRISERGSKRHRPGGILYNDLYGEVPPKRGTFFSFQVYERVGIHKLRYIKG